MSEISDVLSDALMSAAGVDRIGDAFGQLPRSASPSSARRFRLRVISFLEEMPSASTVSDLLDELRQRPVEEHKHNWKDCSTFDGSNKYCSECDKTKDYRR